MILLFFIIIISAPCFSQSKSYRAGKCTTKSNYCPKIALFHETVYNFAGLGINSINADIVLMCNRSYMASIRLGINYYSFPKIASAGIPVEFNFMMGRGAWLFETGLGLNYLYVYKNYSHDLGHFKDNLSYAALTARVGVRYERINGLFFRAGYNPHISLMNYEKIEPIKASRWLNMISVGIGYTFNN
ncbi:MAG: hypothetical protein WCQ95_13545 [Bacteroidota bacterium]